MSSFAFLSIAARALGPADFAPLATLWIILNAVGLAIFQPLEQELGRAIAHSRARGLGSRTVFLRTCAIAAAIASVVTAVLVVSAGPLTDQVLGGEASLLVSLVVGLVGLAAAHLTRGAFAGGDDFGRYGWQLGLEGVLRVVIAAGLALAGVDSVGWYGAVLAVGPVAAVLLTTWRLGPAVVPAPPEQTWSQLTRAIAVLMVGTVLAQFVVNAAPVAANVLAEADELARAGVFISVLVLARIPLFVFAAVQAAFLPGLAALVAQDDVTGFHRRLRAVLGVVAALGGAGFLGFVAIGPWLTQVFYGPEFVTTRGVLALLAGGAGLFMLASTLAQTLISLRAYVASVLGWIVGSAVFLIMLAVPATLEQRVGRAFFVATLTAAVLAWVALKARLQRPLTAGPPPGPPALD